MQFNFKGVTGDTWGRIISMFLILVNLVANELFNFQLIPFEDEQIYDGVSVLLFILVSFWTAWKNNSFTQKAQEADKTFRK